MLKVGVDSSKFPDAPGKGAVWLLEQAAALGLDGVFFRSVLELSEDLDPAELRDAAQAAEALGLRVEAGVGKVNPFANPESPTVRALGDGDYLLGLRRMIISAADAGIRELWTATANYQFRFSGLYACDRFRTDVSWPQQLAAIERFLGKVAPIARDVGVHLDIETHEEITTFELVRIVEAVGADVLGITFDTANVLVRCEDPVRAMRRAAPYVRTTHIRDVALAFTDEGIGRFLLPVGQGMIDWPALLAPLAGRDVMLSIEGIIGSRAEMSLHIDDERWLRAHPDLTAAEALEVVRLTRAYEARAAAGSAPDLHRLRAPVTPGEPLEFIRESARRLRELVASLPPSTEERTEHAHD
ncbi:sugar phosphate isomerase/epimerase family protein [Nonomuraea sp. NPDC050536]|uniref:sugar phosphate isomerase/epimerase family protein n=1 Tax=Nonomuraea sp. NPDC050536 TaxID=3364366 RepID=UPI0037CBBFE7